MDFYRVRFPLPWTVTQLQTIADYGAAADAASNDDEVEKTDRQREIEREKIT